MKRLFIFIILLNISFLLSAQDSIVQNGYQKFYHSNGNVASEGYMQDGKPNGYWKTYYTNGVIKSEGNRSNFELDSTWKFYDRSGQLTTIINYKAGIYHGDRFTFLEDRIVLDPYVDGKKIGLAKVFYPDSTLWIETPFENGVESGLSTEYAKEDGRIISLIHYKNGFPFKREYINRKDGLGRKQGIWKTFHDEGELASVSEYSSDIKNGYFKWFTENGELIKIEKYVNGALIEDAPETQIKDLKTTYYPDGTIKTQATYLDNVAEGVRKEFNPDGTLKAGYIMRRGRIIGKGIIDDAGKKQGPWIEYYMTGVVKAKGTYTNTIRTGKWLFYHENGELKQSGYFTKDGKHTGEWLWYYNNGLLRREENLLNGILHGDMVEYYTDTTIMLQGSYYQGIREGNWIRNVHGYREEGEFLEDVRNGIWKHYYPNDQLMYEGNYLDGEADGEHIWYFKNGVVKKKGSYIQGVKDGLWKYYNSEGQLMITIRYNAGIEVEYNQIRITPELDPNDFE
jgi:antitoxin component YwqK of YwqJK toxin-antitoxin module